MKEGRDCNLFVSCEGIVLVDLRGLQLFVLKRTGIFSGLNAVCGYAVDQHASCIVFGGNVAQQN